MLEEEQIKTIQQVSFPSPPLPQVQPGLPAGAWSREVLCLQLGLALDTQAAQLSQRLAWLGPRLTDLSDVVLGKSGIWTLSSLAQPAG